MAQVIGVVTRLDEPGGIITAPGAMTEPDGYLFTSKDVLDADPPLCEGDSVTFEAEYRDGWKVATRVCRV